MKPTQTAKKLEEVTLRLHRQVKRLSYPKNLWTQFPFDYAWECHQNYLYRYARSSKEILFLGMNPGPFGMAQTGIPFGEIQLVQDWLKIRGCIKPPKKMHPKRPVEGWECPRSEVSGRRLWGFFKECFQKPEAFFKDHYVVNYCPVIFFESSGRNVTPDKLPKKYAEPLFKRCDEYLKAHLDILKPRVIVGVGKFAEDRAKLIVPESTKVYRILHPSPASPKANGGWAKIALKELHEAGIWTNLPAMIKEKS